MLLHKVTFSLWGSELGVRIWLKDSVWIDWTLLLMFVLAVIRPVAFNHGPSGHIKSLDFLRGSVLKVTAKYDRWEGVGHR